MTKRTEISLARSVTRSKTIKSCFRCLVRHSTDDKNLRIKFVHRETCRTSRQSHSFPYKNASTLVLLSELVKETT